MTMAIPDLMHVKMKKYSDVKWRMQRSVSSNFIRNEKIVEIVLLQTMGRRRG